MPINVYNSYTEGSGPWSTVITPSGNQVHVSNGANHGRITNMTTGKNIYWHIIDD